MQNIFGRDGSPSRPHAGSFQWLVRYAARGDRTLPSMRRIFSCFLLSSILFAGAARAESAEAAWIKLARKGPSTRPAFAFVENNPALPNVLIYGDSISIHYTPRVREKLKDQANVYRLFMNGGDSGSFIGKMKKMQSAMCDEELENPWNFQWDVIQFNVGLHDLKYLDGKKLDKVNGTQVSSIETYKKNLGDIIVYLKQLAPDATLIFATTTPVAPEEPGRKVGDSPKYNAAALEVLASYPEIEINDLYSFTKPHQSEWWIAPDNVHYNETGWSAQGDEVAGVILEALSEKK
ncbi:SGNH/GDSL hydrolase family protein [Pontiellaceae bacterium B1224]|nr:SGNH/GDSL hydrolase family protein [Pontiellaceae bacterium B1224]